MPDANNIESSLAPRGLPQVEAGILVTLPLTGYACSVSDPLCPGKTQHPYGRAVGLQRRGIQAAYRNQVPALDDLGQLRPVADGPHDSLLSVRPHPARLSAPVLPLFQPPTPLGQGQPEAAHAQAHPPQQSRCRATYNISKVSD